MATLVRAILTGFGLKLGSELAKAVGEHVRERIEARKRQAVKAARSPQSAEEAESDESLPAGAEI